MTHIFYCAWLKTQVETCVTGTLDMSQAPLRHKWKPGLRNQPCFVLPGLPASCDCIQLLCFGYVLLMCTQYRAVWGYGGIIYTATYKKPLMSLPSCQWLNYMVLPTTWYDSQLKNIWHDSCHTKTCEFLKNI